VAELGAPRNVPRELLRRARRRRFAQMRASECRSAARPLRTSREYTGRSLGDSRNRGRKQWSDEQ
jgi:hypothetical protein